MSCTSPITGYRQPDGRVVLKHNELTPAVEEIGGFGLPCGRCLDCRIARQRDWALRCEYEAEQHKHPDGSSNTCFITLTYDEKRLPNDWSLDVRAWQLFAKKMRKRVGPFRFLAVGEYGGKFLRPHYHALIFGQDFTKDRIPLLDENGNPYFLSATLAKLWPQGIHTIQLMTPETINYACRYTIDKITRNEDLERVNPFTGETWTVNKPFAVMSRGGKKNDGTNKGGIGKQFYEQFKTNIFPRDKVISKGKEMPVPRYYKNLLKTQDPETDLRVTEARNKFTASQRHEHTPERRLVKKKVTAAKMALRKESKLD